MTTAAWGSRLSKVEEVNTDLYFQAVRDRVGLLSYRCSGVDIFLFDFTEVLEKIKPGAVEHEEESRPSCALVRLARHIILASRSAGC